VTSHIASEQSALDFAAATRWPVQTSAHLLGAGLVLAVIVALPVAPSDLDRHQLPKETVVHLATWLAVLFARPFPPRGVRPAVLWSLAGLTLAAAASALLATNGWLALRATSLILTGAVALITARHVAATGAGSILLAWCATAGVIGAATGLAQAYGLQSPLFAVTRVPGGTFGNRNFMAHFSALTLPILVFTSLRARRLLAVVSMFACPVVVAAIVLSRSRAAWIGTAAGIIVLCFAGLRARRRQALPRLRHRIVPLTAVTTLGIIGALLVPNRLSWRSASPYSDTLIGIANHDDGSGRGRVLQYQNSIALALQHPVLGVGPGNWSVRYADVAPAGDPSWVFGDVVPINPWPSSDWFALASECGLLGVLAVVLLACALVWRGVLGARAIGDRVLAGATLLALLATTFVVGSLDAVLLLPAPLLFVALAAGALLQASDGDVVEDVDPAVTPSRWAIGVPVLLGLLALWSMLQTTAYLVAGSGRSVRRLAWAARIDPGSYPIRIALAQRESCADAKNDIIAAVRMAPNWPASGSAARRCGLRVPR
jgi:O-antigen ligase